MSKRSLPFGCWPSPITATDVARHEGAPNWPVALGEEVWWAEPRPSESGRVALCRTRLDDPAGGTETVLPAPWNARSRVHEYGGRSYALLPGRAGAAVVFSEFGDQRLYLFDPAAGAAPHPLTPDPAMPGALRYIEPVVSPDGAGVLCIREEHTEGDGPEAVRRAIVSVPLDGSAATDPAAVRVVAADHHFLACPRLSPDGGRLSWIGWDHPDMPWDSTELRVADLRDGRATGARTVAGGAGQSVVQAEWGDAATLYCVTDPDGWWNPHRITLDADGAVASGPDSLVGVRREEFGGPLWQLGACWAVPLPDGRLAAVHGTAATRLGLLSPDTGEVADVDTPHTEWSPKLALAGADGGTVVGIAAAPDRPVAPVAVDLADGSWRTLSAGGTESAPFAAFLPRPEARVFTGVGGREVHANLYPPHHPEVTGPAGERAPYVVWVHGGPTSRTPMIYDQEVAYFTSRGIGVVEVNYGGSTGFGRAYRERLRGGWGVVDVEDSVSVAQGLVAEGLADPARLAIRGGSAGGFTSAAALAFSDVFRCAAIQFPIVDLAGWRTGETHDFESHYPESIVGPWPSARDVYERNSPVDHAEDVTAPFVLLQGLEDEICPPVQCERFLSRIRGRGVPHAYLTFEGEQHGFRREDTIRTALEAELSLYAQVFGFETDVPRVELRP
ncbi:dipeptidyl aminopeptidase/acylaminoacyl peptidase [Nocardiopsis mwathae]|uniref:Dipeptidyl aminopeptidase/acylaminoacyl peptidase n=1 Tax=Nocardiopsis mwathae TaxID=1472723 RepID=A0A7X0D5V4_9ACTN|nr:dipeptidyl aminopeptidase/acylaminoacyl peptidase [Nocardiopsis mwathae]